MASCSSDKTVRIWELMKGSKECRVLEGHSGKINAVTVFADAKGHTWVASCSGDKTVRIWDPMKGIEEGRVLEDHSNFVHGVTAVNADGRAWLVTCSEQAIRVWEANNLRQSAPHPWLPCSYANGLTAYVDARGKAWLVSCSTDKTVRIWDAMKDGNPFHVLDGIQVASMT